jgi:hypothetical protein
MNVDVGGRLTSDPNRSSLGLLPSGPDPVGEWLVHRQPPDPISAERRGKASTPPAFCRLLPTVPGSAPPVPITLADEKHCTKKDGWLEIDIGTPSKWLAGLTHIGQAYNNLDGSENGDHSAFLCRKGASKLSIDLASTSAGILTTVTTRF